MNHTLCLRFSKRMIDFPPRHCPSPWQRGPGLLSLLTLGAQVCKWPLRILLSVLLGLRPEDLLGQVMVLFFHFLRNLHPVSHSSCSILLVYPNNSAQGYNFSTFLPTVIFWFLKYFAGSHPDECGVISHCGTSSWLLLTTWKKVRNDRTRTQADFSWLKQWAGTVQQLARKWDRCEVRPSQAGLYLSTAQAWQGLVTWGTFKEIEKINSQTSRSQIRGVPSPTRWF